MKRMKKMFLTVVFLCLSLTACKNNDSQKENGNITESESAQEKESSSASEISELEQILINEDAVDAMILGSDMAERYMSRADFIGFSPKELRLIRNGIYAKNGAIFQSEDLNTYFGMKEWYKGEVPVAEFTEDVISDVERANLELIKEMEAMAVENAEERDAIAALPDAPYLPYLDQYRETGMETDMALAEDMGFYYAVPGTIKHPITFTEEQRLAMENGEEIELVVDEVRGETRMFRKHPDSAPNANVYLWYEAGTGAHLSLEMASADQREIKLPDTDAKPWETSVFGNYLFHNGKGYFTAAYYLGD